MATARRPKLRRLLAVGSAATALAVDVAYGVALVGQGGTDGTLRAEFVLAWVALLGLASAAPAIWRGPTAAGLGTAAAVGLALLGVLAVFSIGLGLLASAGLALLALPRVWGPRTSAAWIAAALGAALSIALLVGGLYFTDLPVFCPQPDARGSGTTLFHGSYSFTCHGSSITVTQP